LDTAEVLQTGLSGAENQAGRDNLLEFFKVLAEWSGRRPTTPTTSPAREAEVRLEDALREAEA
jgi:hypothetical protein